MRNAELSPVTPGVLLDRLGPRQGMFLALVGVLGVAAADAATGYALRLSVLYLIPIAVAAWTRGVGAGIGAALLACLLWMLSFRSEHVYLNQIYLVWEAGVMLFGFIAVAWLSARLRRALSQADERFFLVLEAMQAGVYVTDEGERSTLLYANSAMRRLVGNRSGLSPEDIRARFRAEADPMGGAQQTIVADGGFSSGMVKDVAAGRCYLLQSGPLPWGSNSAVKLSVLTDITAQRQAERLRERHLDFVHQAAHLSALAETASLLAHEINQPLMVIATYIDACQRLLAAPEFDRKEVSAVMSKCHAQAVRAASVIERLREFIRQRQHKPEPSNLRTLLAEVVAVTRPQLEEAQVVLEEQGTASAHMLEVDRILLLQVLVNLVRNGIDAMLGVSTEQRRLTLTVNEPERDEVRIAVADRGAGLDDDARERLFTPFFTTKPNGLGLGLAISRSIIEAHSGRLWAENRPGGGAVFYLSLPVRSP